jgi:hypothetical protein
MRSRRHRRRESQAPAGAPLRHPPWSPPRSHLPPSLSDRLHDCRKLSGGSGRAGHRAGIARPRRYRRDRRPRGHRVPLRPARPRCRLPVPGRAHLNLLKRERHPSSTARWNVGVEAEEILWVIPCLELRQPLVAPSVALVQKLLTLLADPESLDRPRRRRMSACRRRNRGAQATFSAD